MNSNQMKYALCKSCNTLTFNTEVAKEAHRDACREMAFRRPKAERVRAAFWWALILAAGAAGYWVRF